MLRSADRLLTCDYDELSTADRAEALQQARQTARERNEQYDLSFTLDADDPRRVAYEREKQQMQPD